MNRTFSLAKMDALIFSMTALFVPAPIIMAAVSLIWGPAQLLGVAAFMMLIWVMIWVWFRPSRFELTGSSLRIVWPIRSAEFPVRDIDRVERLTQPQFKAQFGRGMRIGAGGLWGGFGLLKTTKGGMLRFYISRIDEYVIVRMKKGRDLMITPESPERFVRTLREHLAG